MMYIKKIVFFSLMVASVQFCQSATTKGIVLKSITEVSSASQAQQASNSSQSSSLTATTIKKDASNVKSSVQKEVENSSSGTLSSLKNDAVADLKQQNVSQGMEGLGPQGSGVTKCTFYCHTTAEKESLDCNDSNIKGAINFDFSGGKTIQLFNNFAYWLRQKGKMEQRYKEDHTANVIGESSGESYSTLLKSNMDAYMNQTGWGAMGAYCLVISTNPVLQKAVNPKQVIPDGKIKLVVQLWYAGDSAVQLWSQDTLLISDGQGFNLQITNEQDDDLINTLQDPSDASSGLSFIDKINLQSPNKTTADFVGSRKIATYKEASNSPRKVRLSIAT